MSLPTSSKKARTRAAAVLGQLAADEVHRLDAVGALVDLGDARVADELLDAMLADVAVAAEHLLRVDRGLEALVGEIALDHRREQAEQVVGLLALRLVGRAAHEIDLQRAPQAPARGPPRSTPSTSISIRRTSGWTMIGSALASGSRSSSLSARLCRRSRA